QWHADIAKALLESWDIASDLVTAIYEYRQTDRDVHGPATLADALAVGELFVSFKDQPDVLEAKLEELRAAARFGLGRSEFDRVVAETAAEIAALREALGN
ncbi:MAG: hypothetical protein NZM12_10005, partial [Steroidobacteraceae bacterium]|nr:hypothetical protein [Steroidobacteraceae bacterium]MDW8257993.1 hypothetical protein [Gammaproteobacteria bacterium]